MTRKIFRNATALVAPLLYFALSMPLVAETSCDATMMSGQIEQLSTTHATVNTSIVINAASEDVWAILTDFDSMADWSTETLQNMTGDIQDGGAVTVVFIFGVDENGEPNQMEIPHTLIYDEGRSFGWSDPFPEDIGGGRDNHVYRVEPCGNQTLFVQSDEVVDNPYAANFVSQLLPMYQTFNAELKSEVESR